jgi:8-oxo-dGTP diphosphatase
MTDRPRAAVALFVNDRGEVLAVSRKDNHADLGLVGGKVDPGETFDRAVIRETEEEVGIRIISMELVFDWPDREFEAKTFRILKWEGEPTSKEAAVTMWVAPQKLLEPHCSFREYNRVLFEKLHMI